MIARLRFAGLLVLMGWAGSSAACMAAETEVISTAPSSAQQSVTTSAPVTAGAQLSAWGREADDGSIEQGPGDEPVRPALRTVHGEVIAGIGSGGYREIAGIADLPVGKTGDLIVAGSQGSFDGHGFDARRQSVAIGLFLNGAKPQACDRNLEQRDAGESDLAGSVLMRQGMNAVAAACPLAQQRFAPPPD